MQPICHVPKSIPHLPGNRADGGPFPLAVCASRRILCVGSQCENRRMLIRAYGLFWRADEVNWHPGRGTRGQFMLLGRRGRNRPSLQLADFRRQSGLYILYGDYGPHYVGLARENSLGGRLKRHRTDRHTGRWDRFSWFGFRSVLTKRDVIGLRELKPLSTRTRGQMHNQIGELEALLISALGLENNFAKMRFPSAKPWTQVKEHEVDDHLDKVARR
jgi:hypothetical protein